MEKLDRKMEERVWSRVQGRIMPDMPLLRRENLKLLILEAQENAVAFRTLALQLIGKPWESLKGLESESMHLVGTLRGLSALQGEPVKLTPLPQQRDQPRKTLEKCFHRARHLWEELDRRSQDPEYGMVYRKLRELSQEHCARIAELFGKLD